MGKISIVIPLFNKEKVILNTLESVLSQDYDSYEIIIVDDGSTDKSIEKIETLTSDKITIVRKSNGGPASARNMGVRKASGNWILFLDADDTLLPGALRHFSELIKNVSDCHFFCCNHYLEKDGERFLYSQKYKRGYVLNNFLAWNANELMPRAGAALFSRTIALQHPFKENLRRYEDAEILFDIMRTYRCYRDPKPVMSYNLSTLEASAQRKDISEDFIGHLSLKGKGWMEQYALYLLYLQGLQLYPDDMERLYGNNTFNHKKFHYIGKLVRRLNKMHLA